MVYVALAPVPELVESLNLRSRNQVNLIGNSDFRGMSDIPYTRYVNLSPYLLSSSRELKQHLIFFQMQLRSSS